MTSIYIMKILAIIKLISGDDVNALSATASNAIHAEQYSAVTFIFIGIVASMGSSCDGKLTSPPGRARPPSQPVPPRRALAS